VPGCQSGRASARILTPRALALVSLWLFFITPRPTAAQSAPPGPTLRVTGIVERHLVLHDSDLQTLPRKHVAVTDDVLSVFGHQSQMAPVVIHLRIDMRA
jgi:hypothetical protein